MDESTLRMKELGNRINETLHSGTVDAITLPTMRRIAKC